MKCMPSIGCEETHPHEDKSDNKEVYSHSSSAEFEVRTHRELHSTNRTIVHVAEEFTSCLSRVPPHGCRPVPTISPLPLSSNCPVRLRLL